MAWPNGNRLKTFASGGSFLPGDANNIEDRMLQIAGHRGAVHIATEEARANTAYGLMTTPDRVQGIVLPTKGLIVVAYQANWKSSVASAGNAAIFLGANQLKGALNAQAAPVVQEANTHSTADSYRPLSTSQVALVGSSGGPAYSGDVTTGQILTRNVDISGAGLGGPLYIFAAAGTYDVSIQFKATSGSVTVKDRKLWVWTEAFE